MNIAPDYAFTFTSFDDGVHPGGWQVKDEWTPPDAYAREFLLAGIRTDLGTWDLVPQFPTKAQRLQLPRRLEHRTLPDGRSAVWNSIAAGPDASGRPGNVFVTGLVLSSRNAATHRAIDVWRSSSLPEPFGPREVAVAQCPPQPVLRAGTVSAEESVSKFLLPDYPAPDRAPLLLVLLDAVANAVRGQAPGITLFVENSDEAAAWIASICAFASPGWSSRFSWSTCETPQSLNEKSVQSLHLVAVPADSDGLPEAGSNRVNVNVREELERILDVGRASTPRPGMWAIGGREAPIGEWSRLAKTVVDVEPEALATTLLDIRIGGSTTANDPTEALRRLTGEFVPSATQTAVTGTPPETPTEPVTHEVVPTGPDRGEDMGSEPQALLPPPSSWREEVQLLTLDQGSWVRRDPEADSPACYRARGELARLGLDPNGGFVNRDFLAIVSPEADVTDGTFQQLVRLSVHATGGRNPERLDVSASCNLLWGLLSLDGSPASLQMRCRYMAEAFLASVRIDLEGHASPDWESRRALLWYLFNWCTKLAFEDVWSRVTAWQEDAEGTLTAREFVNGQAPDMPDDRRQAP